MDDSPDPAPAGGIPSGAIPRDLLPGLDERQRVSLQRYSVEARVRSGKALYWQGDAAESAWLLVSGRMRPVRMRGSSPTPMDDVYPGGWLCLPEAWLGLTCLCDAVAVEACTLRRVGAFNLAALRREPWFRDFACGLLARQCCGLFSQLESPSATGRVARAVAAACAGLWPAGGAGAGGTLRLELAQSELAESAGLTRETVNRCLKRLEAAGLLETGRGCTLVYDLAGLRAWED